MMVVIKFYKEQEINMLAYDHYGSRYKSKYSITVHSTGP